jgi:histidinol-phosphate/aromatic aminotransferase/cobyric acid decarboxylase-like protein
MTKTEACRRIGITNKTLQKILSEMNLKEVYPSDINRILLKYPKFIKKAAKVEH